jgi:hypothetical protein
MADHDHSPPTDDHHDDHHPRGGPWVRWTVISFALILGVAMAPQSWKVPLGALSILALLVGVGSLMLGKGSTD